MMQEPILFYNKQLNQFYLMLKDNTLMCDRCKTEIAQGSDLIRHLSFMRHLEKTNANGANPYTWLRFTKHYHVGKCSQKSRTLDRDYWTLAKLTDKLMADSVVVIDFSPDTIAARKGIDGYPMSVFEAADQPAEGVVNDRTKLSFRGQTTFIDKDKTKEIESK